MFARYTLSCVLKIMSILLIICYAKYVVCFTLPISLIIVKKLLSLIMIIMRKNNDNDNTGNKGSGKDDGYNL